MLRSALFNFYAAFLWGVDSLLLSFVKSSKKKSKIVLLVRMDNIGDFILWVPSVVHIRSKYKKTTLVLVANKSFAKLAEDTNYFDQVISIDTRKFMTNIFYRLKTSYKVFVLNVEIAIQPNYSRQFLKGDSVVRASNATQRVGSTGDLSNISIWQKQISDQWYTKLIVASDRLLMEFDRNSEFLSGLEVENNHKYIEKLPSLVKLSGDLLQDEGEYFIIFPGASWRGRKWSNESFARIGREISEQYRCKMVVCGLRNEHSDANEIIDQSGLANKAVNLAGETTLSQFCELVRGARLLIGNETSAVHIAFSTDTPSVCLLGGGHYGRFLPYPEHIIGVRPVTVSKRMDCFGCNWKCTKEYKEGVVPCISGIEVVDVLEKIHQIYKSL